MAIMIICNISTDVPRVPDSTPASSWAPDSYLDSLASHHLLQASNYYNFWQKSVTATHCCSSTDFFENFLNSKPGEPLYKLPKSLQLSDQQISIKYKKNSLVIYRDCVTR